MLRHLSLIYGPYDTDDYDMPDDAFPLFMQQLGIKGGSADSKYAPTYKVAAFWQGSGSVRLGVRHEFSKLPYITPKKLVCFQEVCEHRPSRHIEGPSAVRSGYPVDC